MIEKADKKTVAKKNTGAKKTAVKKSAAKKTSAKKEVPAKPAHFLVYCDGASRSNPGPASIGCVLYKNGEKEREISERIGNATNNVAEYRSLIAGIAAALEACGREIIIAVRENSPAELSITTDSGKAVGESLDVYMDSELAVRQINGIYKVKHRDLIPLHRIAKELLMNFSIWKIHHVPREKNTEADRLANLAFST